VETSRAFRDVHGKPGGAPTYLISEAAHYLCLPATTVRSWITGNQYQTKHGTRRSPPLAVAADPRRLLLSFLNLVELHVISSVCRVHGVKPKPVRRAIDYLGKTFHSDHPLLQRKMLTDGKSLFIERYGQYVNISQDGQLQMKSALEAYLKRIEWDASGLPIRLYPFTCDTIERSPHLVVIDPKIRSGKPCIAGTGIPTGIISERHRAGDSIALLAEDYGRSPEEIEEAIRYESRTAA
jgi:uncharacterized protein (DUF433 family)